MYVTLESKSISDEDVKSILCRESQHLIIMVNSSSILDAFIICLLKWSIIHINAFYINRALNMCIIVEH